jgi:hypothetical protein
MADRLPRANRALVAREKLEGYLLNPQHEVGRHKARVFASALGIQRRDWQYLGDQLRTAVVDAPVRALARRPGAACTRSSSRSKGLINGQTRQVATVWLVAGDEPPRLVTAYVADEPTDA